MLIGVRVRTRLRPRRYRSGPAVRLSDDQVLEARLLHEKHAFGASELLRLYGIEVTHNTRSWMSGILRYQFRSSPTKPLDPALVKGRR